MSKLIGTTLPIAGSGLGTTSGLEINTSTQATQRSRAQAIDSAVSEYIAAGGQVETIHAIPPVQFSSATEMFKAKVGKRYGNRLSQIKRAATKEIKALPTLSLNIRVDELKHNLKAPLTSSTLDRIAQFHEFEAFSEYEEAVQTRAISLAHSKGWTGEIIQKLENYEPHVLHDNLLSEAHDGIKSMHDRALVERLISVGRLADASEIISLIRANEDLRIWQAT